MNLPSADTNAEPLEKKEDDGICRISSKEKNLRARIGYCLNRLSSGHPITLQAYGQAVNKAILVSSICRTKVGDLHMLTKLETITNDKRETQGVIILLSKDALDTTDVGYQAPEPKGFWVRKPRAKPEKKDETEKKRSQSARRSKSTDTRSKAATEPEKTKDQRRRSASRKANAKQEDESKRPARRNRSRKPKATEEKSVEKPARDRKKAAAKEEPAKEKPNRRQR